MTNINPHTVKESTGIGQASGGAGCMGGNNRGCIISEEVEGSEGYRRRVVLRLNLYWYGLRVLSCLIPVQRD